MKVTITHDDGSILLETIHSEVSISQTSDGLLTIVVGQRSAKHDRSFFDARTASPEEYRKRLSELGIDALNPSVPVLPEVDYTKMEGRRMIEACGDSGAKWAAAFCQIAAKRGVVQRPPEDERDGRGFGLLDESWLAGWFANAIEHSTEVRRQQNRQLSASEAVFGFAAWLTTRERDITFGAKHECSEVAPLCDRFIAANRLAIPRDRWNQFLEMPTEPVEPERASLAEAIQGQRDSRFQRTDTEDSSTLTCQCGATITWSGLDDRLPEWEREHASHQAAKETIQLSHRVEHIEIFGGFGEIDRPAIFAQTKDRQFALAWLEPDRGGLGNVAPEPVADSLAKRLLRVLDDNDTLKSALVEACELYEKSQLKVTPVGSMAGGFVPQPMFGQMVTLDPSELPRRHARIAELKKLGES